MCDCVQGARQTTAASVLRSHTAAGRDCSTPARRTPPPPPPPPSQRRRRRRRRRRKSKRRRRTRSLWAPDVTAGPGVSLQVMKYFLLPKYLFSNFSLRCECPPADFTPRLQGSAGSEELPRRDWGLPGDWGGLTGDHLQEEGRAQEGHYRLLRHPRGDGGEQGEPPGEWRVTRWEQGEPLGEKLL